MVDNTVDDMDVETSTLLSGIIQSSTGVHASEPSPNSPGTKHDTKKAMKEGAATSLLLLDDGVQCYTSEGIIDLEMTLGTPGVPAVQLPGLWNVEGEGSITDSSTVALEKQSEEEDAVTPLSRSPMIHQITYLNKPPSPGSNVQGSTSLISAVCY